jgi:hypothetical protein
MTVTTQNYFNAILKIDWKTVPDSLKKTRDTLIPDASRDDWKVYNSDGDVRRVVEKYFGYIGKYATSETKTTSPKGGASPKAKRKEPDASEKAGQQKARELAVALIRPYVERGETLDQIRKSYLGTSNHSGSAQVRSNKIIVDRIGQLAVNFSFTLSSIFNEIKASSKGGQPKPKSSSKAKKVAALPEPKQVVHIPTSTAFIKRYVALHGKVKTRDQIVSLIHGLQKAITEQRIKTGNPALREIEKMQTELIALASSMGHSAKIEIDSASLAHYKQISQGEEVRTSVRLLKSFITMNGKAYDKAKAAVLRAKMDKALQVIPKEDPYLSQLATAMKALATYGEGKDETITIPTANLHGLGSIAAGDSLNGLGAVPGTGEGAIIRLLRAEGVKNLSDATLKKAFRRTVVPSMCLEIARDLIRRGELTMDVLNNPPLKKRFTGMAGIEGDASSANTRITDLDILEMRLRTGSSRDGATVKGLGSVTPMPQTAQPNREAAQSQSATPMQPAVAVSARELAKMRFKTIGYSGRFKEVVGDPAMGFRMMVYGKPFNGKSSFVIELCKDFAQLNKGKVAYLALEEGISLSMQKKIIDRKADNIDGLDFLGSMPSSFKGYSFVVIDSVSDRAISRDKLREIFLNNPQTCFICIFHATKTGSARGGLDYSHDMDIIIRIDKHKPFTEKNRFL